MRVDTLPSPGLLSNGIRLRIEAAKAISAAEINAGLNGGTSSTASNLHAFFTACVNSLTALRELVVPTIASFTAVAGNPSRITLKGSEGFDPKFVPAGTAFAVTGQARTVGKVTVDGPFIYLDLTVPLAAGAVNVAYTQPGAASNLRDIAGNLLASFTAQAVTNTI
jgi:hypothetical protein